MLALPTAVRWSEHAPRPAALALLLLTGTLAAALTTPRLASQNPGPKQSRPDAFRQLDQELPTPTESRLGSGAPGPAYWQQRADYVIDVALDDANQRITGRETITYHNLSPHPLEYLWVQMDLNQLRPDSDSVLTGTADRMVHRGTNDFERLPYASMRRILARQEFDGGIKLTGVLDKDGQPLSHTVVKTMMRLNLPEPLPAGDSTSFTIGWTYRMNPSHLVGARTGAEFFERDGNWIYELAHWFPRMAAYTDLNGWENKQFLGRGEFTLEFGDYEVRITVPADHIVAATGELQNPEDVLSGTHRQRLQAAAEADRPMFIVTPEEAAENEREGTGETRTWVYRAENVRDFAWASSRKFIWDAVQHESHGNDVWCMSYYPNEGEPMWSRFSTQAIMHTLDVYSRFTFPYPYPVAISVNGPVGGMEYPMICFNGPRPLPDGTYSERTKRSLVGVIIHEVGHNYFPMIVNSDERQWTWMDEGLNTFLQYLAEQEWEDGYQSRRGEPWQITGYMASAEQVPIMTHSDSILQFGSNAYAKPATALNILRESVMGREEFDHAFRTYSRRWMFKRPYPADFFRTMEDASAVDLDWFWRGWFYSTDHCDLALTGITQLRVDTLDPEIEKAVAREERAAQPRTLSQIRNAELTKRVEVYPEVADFYTAFDDLAVTPADRRAYERAMSRLEPWQREMLATDLNFYVLEITNEGGLVMPVILDLDYADGSREQLRIPAEIWRYNPERITKLVMTPKELAGVTLDPHLETADVDLSDNHWPRRMEMSRFQLFQRGGRNDRNPMQAAREEAERNARRSDDRKPGGIGAGSAGAGANGGGGR